MKINKPYTTSEGEKNRIRGLHESVKNKNFINEQSGFWVACEAGTCQCVRGGIVPPGGQTYPNEHMCNIDPHQCCYTGTTGPTYDCTPNGCQQVTNGQYNTYQDCQAACNVEWCCLQGGNTPCHPVSNPLQCDFGTTYPTQLDCFNNCGGAGGWECQMPPGGGAVQCVSDPHGQYATLQDCQMMCDQQDMWSCDHQAGNCHQDPNGQFSTLHDCQMMCRGHMTWKCKNKGSHPKFGKKCVQVQSGGDFATKQKCVDSGCQGIGPDIPKDREVGMFRGGESPAQLGEGKLPKGWKMVTPAELDEEDMMDDLYEVWLGHENKIGMVQETPNLRKPRIFELPTRFGNKRLTEIELVNMINTIIK
tara:strand:- start:117 stop:1199 length:1083 start_codon:yes stop_codon:yes gene_type:complete